MVTFNLDLSNERLPFKELQTLDLRFLSACKPMNPAGFLRLIPFQQRWHYQAPPNYPAQLLQYPQAMLIPENDGKPNSF
jgi:hypothetical protein